MFEPNPIADGTKEIIRPGTESSAASIVGGRQALVEMTRFAIDKQVSLVQTCGTAGILRLESETLTAFEGQNRHAAQARISFHIFYEQS